jgi:hypothetical protein
MGSSSLSERLDEAKSGPPLTEEERIKAFVLDELSLRIETNNVRISILNRLMKEDDITLEGSVSKADYEQIAKEWDNLYEILSKNSLKKIRLLIESEKINNPDNYLPLVEDRMITRELKIQKFFTFNRYLSRRRNNLDKDYIRYIKEMALKNDAYEFLEALKENQEI